MNCSKKLRIYPIKCNVGHTKFHWCHQGHAGTAGILTQIGQKQCAWGAQRGETVKAADWGCSERAVNVAFLLMSSGKLFSTWKQLLGFSSVLSHWPQLHQLFFKNFLTSQFFFFFFTDQLTLTQKTGLKQKLGCHGVSKQIRDRQIPNANVATRAAVW